ncbi:MAG TPA: vitamin K epoxide reductase family protein [Chthoniobacterales bacterium]|nr:vitamin K epoxide reductase family protein [Chthoniobacterales bacterium]
MKPQTAADKGSISRPQRLIYIGVAVISLLGLAETTYLTALHLAGAHVVCVTAANCSQVLGSVYASIAGVPLAAVGAAGYFTVFSFVILALFQYRLARTLLALTVTAMFLATLCLLYLQAFVLHAFCDYCLFSAALIFLLAGLLIAMPPRPPLRS